MQNKSIKFVFFGTPEISVRTLEILKNHGFLPSLIVTNPDSKKGRGMHLTPSPVAIWAKNNSIPCLKPEILEPKALLRASPKQGFGLDLFIVVAYGKILPEELINLPKFGTINLHYSLLPKYRGASPVEEALLNGDTETGVSIQKMQFRLDSGPILAEEKVPIDLDETKIDLLNKLVEVGGNLLTEILSKIMEGKTSFKEQDEREATFCKKIKGEDGLITEEDLFESVSNPEKSATLYNKYRAFFGWPGTYFFRDGKRYKITKAKLENDKFIIEKVIPESKKEINFNTLK